MASVYRKTDKGTAEIETRAHRLAPRLRTALIMVDGRRSDDDLRQLIGGDSATDVLATLLADGFVEVIGTVSSRASSSSSSSSSSSAASSASSASSAPASSSGKGWEERRRQAVRFLNDQLGPSAEALVLKIEKARNWDELKPHLEMGEHFVRSARGGSAAREYAAKFLDTPAG